MGQTAHVLPVLSIVRQVDATAMGRWQDLVQRLLWWQCKKDAQRLNDKIGGQGYGETEALCLTSDTIDADGLELGDGGCETGDDDTEHLSCVIWMLQAAVEKRGMLPVLCCWFLLVFGVLCQPKIMFFVICDRNPLGE